MKELSLLAAALLILLALSCKQNLDEPKIKPKSQASNEELEAQRSAGTTGELDYTGRLFQQVTGQILDTQFDDQLTSGKASPERMPYSGFWYPESQGGTGISVAGSSALALYDQAFHAGQSKAQAWEQQYHSAGKTPDTAWFGHCNGFAAASQRHTAPEKAVQRNGVTFQPHHIRALLAEIYMSQQGLSLGGQDCRGPEGSFNRSPKDRSKNQYDIMGPCENVNPGTFHVMITNWLGKLQHPILFDQRVGIQKWNYPLYSFEVLSAESVTNPRQASSIVGLDSDSYPFNPSARSWRKVITEITYASARGNVEVNTQNFINQPIVPAFETYAYLLELDESKRIIGGEWIATNGTKRNEQGVRIQGQIDSTNNHPDYLWLAMTPKNAAIGEDIRHFNNPNVDVDNVLSLWRDSVSNPDARSLFEDPESRPPWGQFADFAIELNGLRRGAVFSQEDVHVRIEKRKDWSTPTNITVAVNGKPMASADIESSPDWSGSFQAAPGLNQLTLTWTRAGQTILKEEVFFHAFP